MFVFGPGKKKKGSSQFGVFAMEMSVLSLTRGQGFCLSVLHEMVGTASDCREVGVLLVRLRDVKTC